MTALLFLKQTAPIRAVAEPPGPSPSSLRRVYALTAFVSLGGFLFGWNQGVMGMIIADDRWLHLMQPSSDWAVGFVVSVYNISCAIGALAVGVLADIYGRERTLALASVACVAGALMQAAARTMEQMTLGRFIVGLGVGAYAAGVPLYVSEIAPASLRGRVVGIELMILCFAEMVVFFVDYACFFLDSPDWWRIPLAIQVVPAIVLAVGCWTPSIVPPSPRWLVAEERFECALQVLTRLHGSDAAEREMDEIRANIADQRRDSVAAAKHGTWADMFRGPALRVTILGAGVQFFQQITGTNAIFYYTPYLFRHGGITDPRIANLATAGAGVVLFLSAWIPVLWFDRFGRKTWLQLGLVGMFCALIGIAVLQRHAESHPGDPANYAIIVFPLLFFTSFNSSWSSGSWTYAAEIFPSSLRAKGNALCTASLWISNFIVAQVTPPIVGAISWGLYVILAVINVLAFSFVRYCLVETRGKSLEEMARLFGLEDAKHERQGDRSPERRELLRSDSSGSDPFNDEVSDEERR